MFRSGLALLGILSVFDVAAPAMTDGEHPPMSIAVFCAVLGVASLACSVAAWRGHRVALMTLIGLRVVSAATSVPAFFVAGVPAVALVAAAVTVVLTIAGVVLVLATGRARMELAR
jgi:hypothetical protein